MIWTDEKAEELRVRWERGESAGIIAAAIGDISRCAVLGKARRMNLPLRLSSVTKPMGRKPQPDTKKRKPVMRSKPSRLVDLSNVMVNRRGPSAKEKAESIYANMTKNQLRAMLTQAVINTAAMA